MIGKTVAKKSYSMQEAVKKLHFPKTSNFTYAKKDLEKITKDYTTDALMESVSVHLRSDVPYCVFFSGGIDSTLVLYFMSLLKLNKIKLITINLIMYNRYAEKMLLLTRLLIRFSYSRLS